MTRMEGCPCIAFFGPRPSYHSDLTLSGLDDGDVVEITQRSRPAPVHTSKHASTSSLRTRAVGIRTE